MAFHTYDPKSNSLSWGGTIISGFAEDSLIEVERTEDSSTLKVGADGEAARSMSNNRSGTITFRLMASASCNDLLSAAMAEDELLRTAVRSVFMKELRGTTTVVGAAAWLTRPANIARGKEVGETEWVLQVADMTMTVGGLTL